MVHNPLISLHLSIYLVMKNIVFFFALFLCSGSLFSQVKDQPNIVLILIDDCALMDLGAYGGEAATPNIDKLAGKGTIFTNYHASPMCAPSRSMLMTGYDSHLTGVPNLPIFTPPDIAKRPGYEGILNDKVETVATRLKRQGYHTYTTGKWHLGHTETTLPSKRGFDRTYILDASGADNYEQRPYLPTQEAKPPWFKDGQPIDLPEDFYSSKNLVDEMISFHKEEERGDNPFFSYLAFQAIHIPVQAPKKYIDKYIDTYSRGWAPIREQRHNKAKQLGLIPEDAPLGEMLPILQQWENLSEEDKKYKAKAMAVNAGMLEAMDHHIGRYIDYLDSINEIDNTIFIVTSDNGPEASNAGSVKIMELWLKYIGNYHQDYERLGEKGSFNFIGPEFASAAASPSAYFKFYAGEGGLRVPLIFSGPGIPEATSRDGFSWITDVTPTIMDLAGINQPVVNEAGPMTGRSLYQVIQKDTIAYSSSDVVGLEAAGQCALYKGDHKLTRNGRPYGDGLWRMYNLKTDPGEIIDLKESKPTLFADLIKEYNEYATANGVIEMGINYEPLMELQSKAQKKFAKALAPWLIGAVVLACGFYVWRRRKRKSISLITNG